MPPMDQTGKNLHKGQLVHVHLNGMFSAYIADMMDSKIVAPGQPPMPPLLVLDIVLSMPIVQNTCGVYIVKNADPEVELSTSPESLPNPPLAEVPKVPGTVSKFPQI